MEPTQRAQENDKHTEVDENIRSGLTPKTRLTKIYGMQDGVDLLTLPVSRYVPDNCYTVAILTESSVTGDV